MSPRRMASAIATTRILDFLVRIYGQPRGEADFLPAALEVRRHFTCDCPSRGSAKVIVLRDRISDLYENCPAPDLLQHLHDHCLVRPSEIPAVSAPHGHPGELVNCLRGVLFSGSRQPHRLWRIQRLPAENHPGSNHAVRVYRVRVDLSRRGGHLELRRGLSLSGGSRAVCLLGET